MVGSLLQRSKFYRANCLSEPPTLRFKEPHMATTLRAIVRANARLLLLRVDVMSHRGRL